MKYPVPLLTFNDPAGTDLAEFNTIRLGGAWAKRLKKGQRVLLATKLEVFGSAKVDFIVLGPLVETLAIHARDNHIEWALYKASLGTGVPYHVEDAPGRRLESMRKNYGPHKVMPGCKITVIGLRL